MHTYRETDKGWEVGMWLYERSDDNTGCCMWCRVSKHKDEQECIKRVNYLNGGSTSFAP